MKYQVIVPKKVQREIDKIDNRFRLKIIAALTILSGNPFLGKKLEGDYKGNWSFRVWPYRIIYRIENKKMIVLIVKVGHRGGVYKK